ncbi:MAG: DUF5067 domain-containing protein [Clostridia bacterium]|nr:DUF5067 domain-containing protein [Clostridia bacterium]
MKKLKNLFLLLLCSIMFLVFAVGSGSNVTTSTDSNGTQSSTNNLATYKLNDDIYVTNNSGKYRIKFTKISETSYRNPYSDKQANKVVLIEYEYENISQEDDLYISEFDFKLYDKENNQLETYPADTKYASNVSKGRKTTASVAYALNSDSNYIELEFYDNMFNSKANCKVVFEW